MSAQRKRDLQSSSVIDLDAPCGDPPTKKRSVQKKTVEKWIVENDKELNTSIWLQFETAAGDRDHVAILKCAVCSRFKERLQPMRNYRPALIEGTSNVRTSTFKDHADTDMHKYAMILLKKAQSSGPCDYAPIARALAQSSMNDATTMKIKRKFETAYVIAKEKLAFTKMKPICELEERHGVDLGLEYQNDKACSTFIEFIAREQQDILLKALEHSKFLSFQADASTDAGNEEVEMFLVLHFDPSSTDGKVYVRNRFFAVRHLSSATAEGLFDSFKRAVGYMQLDAWKTKMIGFGCDGTNANIAQGGLRGLLSHEMPWVFVFWCLAHRLELSVKGALKPTFFTTVDDLLLRLYYIYEKSPKKCRELEGIVVELKACLEPAEMPRKGGTRPLRACGTRFITHKVAALERMMDRFGAYISHLIAMTEDPSVKPADKEKMKAYVKKWQDSKVLLGCAFFHDLLKSVATLCKVLQEDELCVVRAIEAVFKTKQALDKLKTVEFEQLPSVKKVLARVQEEENGSNHYQRIELKAHDRALTYLKSHYKEWIEAVEKCLRERMRSQDTELLTHAMTLLATNGWERSESASFGYAALDTVCERFQVPLENASVDLSLVQEEWDDMVGYGKQYLNLVREDYKVIWWKLFNAVDAKGWTNVLAIIELLFCLPMANGRLERVFSQLKLIKNDRRTCLKEDTLDQLVRINVEGPPLSNWDASGAFELWMKEKVRRVNQQLPQHHSTPTPVTINLDDDDDAGLKTFSFDDWEEWIES